MRAISIVIIMVLLGGSAIAQTKEEKKAAKKAKKEAKLEQDKANTAMLMSLVESKKFVLEANTLFDRTGVSYVLNSSLNFIGFDGVNSTIQLAFDQLIGWNGVGGVTIDGKITKRVGCKLTGRIYSLKDISMRIGNIYKLPKEVQKLWRQDD